MPQSAASSAASSRTLATRVIAVADGENGLRAVREHQPDVVILDLNLPRMDGLEICRRLRADRAHR